MSTLIPPVPLANQENQFRADYIKSIAPLSDFDYTQVTFLFLSPFQFSKRIGVPYFPFVRPGLCDKIIIKLIGIAIRKKKLF